MAIVSKWVNATGRLLPSEAVGTETGPSAASRGLSGCSAQAILVTPSCSTIITIIIIIITIIVIIIIIIIIIINITVTSLTFLYSRVNFSTV